MADFRHALRVLSRRPAFTLVAVLTLAVGIGANTAIFSVVNGVLLRPLPYSDPDRIVRLYEHTKSGPRASVSHPNFLDWRQRSTGFDAMASISGGTETVLGGREPVFAPVYSVSAGFFRVFGVDPEKGRTFTAEETQLGGTPAVVVSHGFWERSLGSESDLARLRVAIDGTSARVVGVMPESFNYPPRADVWIPAELRADRSGRTAHNHRVVARVRSGVTIAQAGAELNAIAAQLKQQYGNDDNAMGATTIPLQESLAAGSRESLLLMLGAVALVLLIACANVATTMLTRGEERRTELAVRAALGAGRTRLVRQLLVESLVIGLAGATGGLLLAGWLLRVLLSVNAVGLPRFAPIGIDARVLLFTLALAFVAPLLFGLVPALQASKGHVRDALAEGGRSAPQPRARVRSVLVAGEVALALMLLVAASLLIRSFANVVSVDPGFETRGAVTADMAVPGAKYPTPERAAQFYEGLVERLRAVPGVAGAGATSQLPLGEYDYGGAFTFEGHPDAGGEADGIYDGFRYSAGYRVVTPGYFQALGMKLKRGRFIAETDRPGQPAAAMVNETFVRKFLPRTDPVGVRFKYAGMDPVNPFFTIVGVTADIHHGSLVTPSTPEVFVSLYQQPYRAVYPLTMVVRAASVAQESAVAASVRDTVRTMDPDVPVDLSTLDRVLANSVADRRFMLSVLGTFAAIALLLAATGIYSVLSQVVAQRRSEIGIRMALGADGRSVVGLMLSSAMRAVVAGVIVGGVGAVIGARLLTAFLFGVRPLDPIAFAISAVVLVAVGLLAAFVPARRATRVDPLVALRVQ